MRFICVLLHFLLIPTYLLFSQKVVTIKDAPTSTLNLFRKGIDHYKSNQYSQAIEYFQKALKKNPQFIEAELQWASTCFDLKDYSCAVLHFQKVLQLDSNFNSKVYYTLALSQYQLDHFFEAKENISTFINREKSNKDLLSKAKILLKYATFADSVTRYPVTILPVFLKSLNSDFSEYLPTISADGKTAVFTRRNFRGDEDLFITYLVDSTWAEATPIKELNSNDNEGSPALSQDGALLIFTICDRKLSYGGCDLYMSELKEGEWGIPYNMGEKINTAAYESNACFAENGRSIYFTSNRKGSIGGYDIWMSRRKNDNSWSIPKNLGSTINSTGNEVSPFLHPNGTTLYYSSDYYPGMGERDLFYSITDVKGHWQAPVNLGYPINSKGDESSFIVFPDGKKAWMASDKKYLDQKASNLRFNLDLYEMILPASLQVKSSTYVEITVSDKISGKPVLASVSIFDLSNNKLFYSHEMTDSEKILIALPTGAEYGLHIYHKDYVFESDQFNCAVTKTQFEPLIIHKKLEKIQSGTGTAISLKNIFFESGSAILKRESQFELNALVHFLKDNLNIKLKIFGHTDDIGAEIDNQILSQNRALSVLNYLKLKGIAIERIFYEGKGESSPIDTNLTEDGRQNNRRIEFTILKE